MASPVFHCLQQEVSRSVRVCLAVQARTQRAMMARERMTTNENSESALSAVQAFANQCIAEVKKALKRFGEYSYYDKGASEVLDLNSLLAEARKLTPGDVGRALLLLIDYEHGEPLARGIVHGLDESYASSEWNEMMGVDARLADLY